MPRILAIICLMAGGIVATTAAQTIPQELLLDAVDTASSPSASPRTLEAQESKQRIKAAGELLRQGLFDDAVRKLRGPNQVVTFDLPSANVDQREIHLARGLLDYADGKNREAFELADAVHRAGQAGAVNVDAALLKSLVLLRAGVFAYAEKWARWAEKHAPATPLAGGLIAALEKTSRTGRYLGEKPLRHPLRGDYELETWRGPEAGDQPLAIVFRKGTSFDGALLIESAGADAAQPRRFRITFRDLDRPPLVIRDCGTKSPDPSELLHLARQLHPGRTTSRYSVQRAELESLYWHRERVAPLAAWWASQSGDSPLVALHVTSPLQNASAGEWTLRDRRQVGPANDNGFILLGFSNTVGNDPQRLSELRSPLQHFHFVVVTPLGNQSVLSAAVSSREPIPNARLYFLEQLDGDDALELKLYDGLECPAYDHVAGELVECLTRAAEQAAESTETLRTSANGQAVGP